LPVLVLVGLGVLLWRSPCLPQEHEVSFSLPENLALKDATVELWQGDQLLRREQRFFTANPHGEWVWTMQLKRGDYRAESSGHLADGGEVHASQTVHLAGSEAVRLPLMGDSR
jgi:hypothetical protein